MPPRPARRGLCVAALLCGSLVAPAQAWVLTVTPGTRALYLQVGTGTNNAANATVNRVSVSVPPALVGNGSAQAMTSDSNVAISFYDNYVVCNPPQQVYIGAWYRTPGTGSTAVLTVSTPANLTSGGDTLPFTSIAWTSTANGNASADIPGGSFTGGTQTLRNVAVNTWVENCLTFSYANTTVPPAGTYTGRATYTLVAP